MKYFFRNLRRHAKRILQIVLVFGVSALVLLYFLGYYDFSFLERGELLSPSLSGSAGVSGSDDVGQAESEGGSGGSDGSDGEASSSEGGNGDSSQSYKNNTSYVYDASMLADKTVYYYTVAQRESSGYSLAPLEADYEYGKSVLGKLTFSIDLPSSLATSARSVKKEIVVYPEDDSEPYVQTRTSSELWPSVEVYMGYILMRVGDEIYLISRDGEVLSRYPCDKYKPANLRATDGKPLFVRVEDGRELYFSLSDDGKSFVYRTEDEIADIGLSFDYPITLGQSDSTSIYIEKEVKYYSKAALDALEAYEKAEKNGAEFIYEPPLVAEENVWGGSITISDTSDETLAAAGLVKKVYYGYGLRNEDGWRIGQLTSKKYVAAYPFTSNRGAVVGEDNRGAMFFVNENGWQAFKTVFTFVNEHNRYVTEYMLPPLTNGVESIGFYYFDEGLTRVRKQTIDYYNYDSRDLVRVVTDYDVLIDVDGNEYELPVGFELKGYSDGVILLRDNDTYKYGFLHSDGYWIAQPIYESAEPFIHGLAVLETYDRRFGMIDTEGNIVLPFTYDYITNCSDGVIAAYRKESGWIVFRLMEKN